MPDPIGLRIVGSGHFLPARIYDNAHFESYLDTSDAWIRERTGIRTRHIAGEGESTATMAVAAARAALDDAKLKPTDLDLIIVATITPEHVFPSTACCVARQLGLTSTPAFDLAATCSGFIYATVTAAHLTRGKTYRTILVIGGETMSRITDYQDRASCILFGDGAGAVVLTALPDATGPALLHHRIHADGHGHESLWVPAGGSCLPASQMTVNEKLHYVKMQGREVFKQAVSTLRQVVESTLSEAGVTSDDVALLISHQSNIRIMEAARAKLGIPLEKMYVNIDRIGNTSAASIPIALDEARRAGRVRSGDLVMFVAFGAGFTWGSMLWRM